MADTTYTDEDLSTFSDKLQAWGESLPDREQALLGHLVSRAAAHTHAEVAEADEAEVAGFSFSQPSSSIQVGDLSRIALSPLSPDAPRGYEKWIKNHGGW